jgi:D-glycero-D-manno-heptose 1,7-bisphosphate phosphatase
VVMIIVSNLLSVIMLLMLKNIKIIILDRDGVINIDSSEFIKSPDEWVALPGSLEAIAKFNSAGYKVVVATNQSGIARGYFTRKQLDEIHAKLKQELALVGGHIDGIFICPHLAEDNCSCRKPKPGLLLEIAEKFGVSPTEMLSVGDSLRDVLAAKAAGAHAVLVKTGNGRHTLAVVAAEELADVLIFDNLVAVADAVIYD